MDLIDNEGRYRYSLTPLPGNNDILVSHGAWVNTHLRGKGLGQQLHQERIEYAKNHGQTYMLATVDADNKAQVHIMQKNGWKELDSFVSECTCHRVILFGRHTWA